MLRRLMYVLLLVLPLAACGESNAPTAESTTAVETPVTVEAPAAATTLAPASTATVAAAASAASPAESVAEPAATETAAAATPAMDIANKPRLGIDYEILPTPQPTYGQGRIEVAEVFSYACIHCAQFQPVVDEWLKHLPADVRYEYVPAVFNQMWENYARAFFAAEALGIQAKTHDAVFTARHLDRTIKGDSLEDIADWYATQGVDRSKFLDAMNSFGVTAKVNRAKQFALRTGIDGTPTIIVNGKYKVNVNAERGFKGMLATTDYLVAQERALSANGSAAK